MATGGPDSWSLTVLWQPGGVFSEERDYLDAGRDGGGIEVTVGGDDWEPAPGVMTGAFVDPVRFVPGNPLSPLHPDVTDGRLTRFSVTKNGTTWVRHRGELSTSAPVISDGDVSTCRVQFESVNILGRLAGTVYGDEFAERWRHTARSLGADIAIVAPSTASIAPTDASNVGSSTGKARIVLPTSRVGTVETTRPDGGILLSTAWHLSKNDANAVGPVLVVDCYDLVPVEVVVLFRTSDRIKAGKAQRYLVQGLDGAGGEEWSLRMVDNAGATDLRFFDSTGGSALVYGGFAGVGDSETGDDQWMSLRVFFSGTFQFFQISRALGNQIIGGGVSLGYAVGATRRVIVGGNLTSRPLGAQTNCTTVQVGAVIVSEAGAVGHLGYADPLGIEPGDLRVKNLCDYSDVIATGIPLLPPYAALTPLNGRSALEAIAEVCRTTGASFVASRGADGTTLHLPASAVRGATPVVTLSIEGDVGPQVQRIRAVSPSRVTASWSGGEVIWERTDAPVRVDESIEVAAVTGTQALHAAQRAAAPSATLRVSEVTVDLSGAEQDVWAAMMALQVGDRVRLSIGQASIGGVIPPLVQHYGVTWVDLWVTGWTERYAEGLAEFVLRTVPADDPVEGTWETDLRGRWSATPGSMTVTGGTAKTAGAGTGTGTIIVTIAGAAAANPAFSTNAGDYPMTLDWNGELVTVTSAPAAASGSPRTQTLTVTARGVAPSVARLHPPTNDTIDVALPATWAP